MQGVKNENANVRYSAFVDLFTSFEMLLNRLSIFTDIPLTQDLKTVLVEIVVQVLSTLALATKQIKQGRFSEFFMAGVTLD